MSASFGIDLGTTNSVIAHLVDGKPVAIPVDGHPIVPSVVLFDGARVIVGREAANLEADHPEQTIRSTKRKMGQVFQYSIGTRALSPEDVSAEILRALKRGAEAAVGHPVTDVVVTVPAYFDDAQRRATLKAGELAGLNVLRLLNEPTSASLIYDQVAATARTEPEILLVYDLGGGTFDVSVLEVFEGVREVRSTTGNTALGGDDFDELLVRRFLDQLRVEQGVDARGDRRAMARLRRLAEETKIRLSADTRVEVKEEFLTSHQGKPVHLASAVTRRDFEALALPLLSSTIELAKKAVAEANLAGQAVSRICLVGGSTRIPLVRSLLTDALGVEIHDEIDADLAVALGAAVQGSVLKGETLSRILVDVAAHSLGIKVLGPEDSFVGGADSFAPLIPRNTVLPTTRSEEFYTVIDDQPMIDVQVFQGESRVASENARVGSFEFPLEPVPEHSPVRVQFAYDLNGVVKVSLSQPGRTNQKTVALSTATAGKAAEGTALTPKMGTVERKALALLAELEGDDREELEGLLDDYRQAAGAARDEAEEALLDFFLDIDDE
jgi:molecular chaperone DnaK